MGMGINNWKKKGIILTIDSIIAITLVTLILIATTNYFVRSQGDVLPELQLVRTGNDIITLLDNVDDFEGMDADELSGHLESLLPATYEMKINLTLKNGSSIETESKEIPDDRFIGTGERIFVIDYEDELTFGIARFWIWSKT